MRLNTSSSSGSLESATAVSPELTEVESIADLVESILLDAFFHARPDAVSQLEFQAPLLADRIARRVSEHLLRRCNREAKTQGSLPANEP